MNARDACTTSRLLRALAAILAWIVLVPAAGAHCDSMDGPVVREARAALEAGDVAPVLKWVRPGEEADVRAAFRRAVAVRSAGGEAGRLADQWFFETLVRLHRAGEGAPYTGLKPAGSEVPAPVRAADLALERNSVDGLVARVQAAAEENLRDRFRAALRARERSGEGVAEGRAWVAAYVEFVHYVKDLHESLQPGGRYHHE